MKKEQNLLVVISAPSGAGKTTLCQKLLADYSTKLTLSISSTTRAPRGKERHGVDYFFLSREEFESQIQENRFLEWAQVHDNYYGTSRAMVEKAFQAGKSVLLDIDVQGAEQLRNSLPEQCLSIFIAPPSLEELEARLIARGTDKLEVIQKRMIRAKVEMEEQHRFSSVIVNRELEQAYAELKIILESKLRSK
ncbi:MAG: guanylate kinase [Bdellovibrionia bacterium]